MNQVLSEVLCPHRGLGDENSLKSIRSAIETRPTMVEFDIQNLNGTYFLGHPPKINKDSTLEDALNLFSKSDVLPKVDLKCLPDWKADISLLLSTLNFIDYNVLLNIGGDNLSAVEFIKAENFITELSKSNILLNIDIARYGILSAAQIKQHIQSLNRKPFSVSPMLEGNFNTEIELAKACGINNIHFWSNNSTTYTENELLEIYNNYSKNETQVLFDIKSNIIVAS